MKEFKVTKVWDPKVRKGEFGEFTTQNVNVVDKYNTEGMFVLTNKTIPKSAEGKTIYSEVSEGEYNGKPQWKNKGEVTISDSTARVPQQVETKAVITPTGVKTEPVGYVNPQTTTSLPTEDISTWASLYHSLIALGIPEAQAGAGASTLFIQRSKGGK